MRLFMSEQDLKNIQKEQKRREEFLQHQDPINFQPSIQQNYTPPKPDQNYLNLKNFRNRR